MAGAARGAAAQSSSAHTMLVAPPRPTDPADSALALDFANELRKKGRSWNREIVSNRDTCRMLRASSYPCGRVMDDAVVAQLAAALHVDAYLTGILMRRGTLMLEMRIASRNRSSFAGSFSMEVAADVKPDSIAALAALGLDALSFGAALTRECYDARDAGNYADAISLATAALGQVPNQSAAALCLATVYEVTDASVPEKISAYARAFTSDRTLDRALTRLVELYFEYGDTLSANVLMHEQLRRAPENTILRARVIYNWITVDRADSAFTLLDPTLIEAEEIRSLLGLILATCVDREQWACAFRSLERQAELDPSVASDTTFLFRIVGAAQNADNHPEVLRWTTRGLDFLRGIPDGEDTAPAIRRAVAALYLGHAASLVQVGQPDSAVATYLAVGRDDPGSAGPLLAAASTLLNSRFLTLDSLTPLDTTAFARADSILSVVSERDTTAAVQQRIAALYLTPAATLVQRGMAPRLASTWLEEALRRDLSDQTRATASALNGMALASVVQELDTAIRTDGTCAMVDEIEETISRAAAAWEAGRTAMPDIAAQHIPMIGQYAALVPQYRAVIGCQ